MKSKSSPVKSEILNYEAVIDGERFDFRASTYGLAFDHIQHHANKAKAITASFRLKGKARWHPVTTSMPPVKDLRVGFVDTRVKGIDNVWVFSGKYFPDDSVLKVYRVQGDICDTRAYVEAIKAHVEARLKVSLKKVLVMV